MKRLLVPALDGEAREMLAAFARAGAKAGIRVEKSYDGGQWANLDLFFGPIKLHMYGARDEVCERVVVGTREVTEEVPDPDALAAIPTVTVTRTVEDVEWRCNSILGAPPVPGGGA
jgi:hypothetical protein